MHRFGQEVDANVIDKRQARVAWKLIELKVEHSRHRMVGRPNGFAVEFDRSHLIVDHPGGQMSKQSCPVLVLE